MNKVYRFSPSPTNQNPDSSLRSLHIGGARTVFLNYIAKLKDIDNKLIMRCEDTDIERSNDECLKCMVKDFEFLGIKFDAGFRINEEGEIKEFNNSNILVDSFRQSNRQKIYDCYIERLMAVDKAYEKDGAVYFRFPKEDVHVHDEILGELTLPAVDCQDFVIRKSNGGASFYFAVTIDDHSMGVTDVIRGTEHVNTVFRQMALIKALSLNVPRFYHIALINDETGKKLSKRSTKGEITVEEFKRNGYIGWPILNYLSTLGWGIKNEDGSNKEEFTLEEMIKYFHPKDLSQVSARFDRKKLLRYNANFISRMTDNEFSNTMEQYGKQYYPDQYKRLIDMQLWDKFLKIYRDRAKTLKEPFLNGSWLTEDCQYNDEDAKKVFDFVIKYAWELMNRIYAIEEWTPENINNKLNEFAAEKGVKVNELSQGLRYTLTGGFVSPPIDRVIWILSKNTLHCRVDILMNYLGVLV